MLKFQHILQRFLFFLQFMKNPWKKCEKIFKKTLVFPTRTYYNGGTIPASAGYIISRRKTYEKEAEAAACAGPDPCGRHGLRAAGRRGRSWPQGHDRKGQQ